MLNEVVNPDAEQTKTNKRWAMHDCRKYTSLVSTLLVNLMVGSYFSYSRINPYVAAYLRQYDANVTNKETLLVLPLWLIVKGIGALLGVKLSEAIGYRTTNALAFVSFTAVTYLTSMLTDYWSFMFIYGIGSGICIGMGYLPSIYVAWTYFPQRKPVITGAALFMSGISASILSPLSIKVLNPHNVNDFESDTEIVQNVPKLFRVYALIFGALTIVGCSLQPPLNEDKKPKTKPGEEPLQQPLAPGMAPQDKKEIEFMNYLERDRVLQEFKTVVTEQDALLWNAMKTDRMSGLIKHDKIAREYNSDKFKRSLTIQIGSRQSKSKAGKTGSTLAITSQEIENPAATMPILAHAELTSPDPISEYMGQPSMNIMGATVRFADFQNDQPPTPNYENLVLQEIIKVESSCPSVKVALKSKHFWIGTLANAARDYYQDSCCSTLSSRKYSS
jgi:Major Facilitator Superfamily